MKRIARQLELVWVVALAMVLGTIAPKRAWAQDGGEGGQAGNPPAGRGKGVDRILTLTEGKGLTP